MKEARYLIVLTGVAVVCAALLAWVNSATKEPIEAAQRLAITEGISRVLATVDVEGDEPLPEGSTPFDNDPDAMKYMVLAEDGTETGTVIYPAMKEGKVYGAAVKTTVRGFSDNIVVMVGILGAPDGELKIVRTRVISSKETPGLGTKLAEPDFADQWKGHESGDQGKEPRPARTGLVVPPSPAIFKVTKDGGDIDAISGATISSRAFCECVNIAVDAWRTLGGNAVKGGK